MAVTDSALDPQPLHTVGPPSVRRFQGVAIIAVVAASVPYLWVLWDLWTGTVNPLRINPARSAPAPIYDVQARALMGGHLSLPTGSISVEAFIHEGRTYTYFGIFPSLLRIPFFLFTHSLDGRLTAISMVASWAVTALFSSLLLWRARVVLRGDAPLGRAETASYGVLLFSFLAGSVLLFLASTPEVYMEDEAWSVALACASLFALLGVLERPSWGRVATSGVFVLLTNLNRGTTGYACVLGTMLVAAWFALGRGGQDQRRWALPIFLAGFFALVVGCAIDLAKFNLLFGFPAAEQQLYRIYGHSHINGGRYFSLNFLPSTLQAYVVPGNLRITSLFPFLTLPETPTHLIAHTQLFNRTNTASVPASMPLLFGAGLWGVITTFAPRRPLMVRSLRILLVASAASAAAMMLYGTIVERLLADFMPLLVLASIVGMVDISVSTRGQTTGHAHHRAGCHWRTRPLRFRGQRRHRHRSPRQLDAGAGGRLRPGRTSRQRYHRAPTFTGRGTGSRFPGERTDGPTVRDGQLPWALHLRRRGVGLSFSRARLAAGGTGSARSAVPYACPHSHQREDLTPASPHRSCELLSLTPRAMWASTSVGRATRSSRARPPR